MVWTTYSKHKHNLPSTFSYHQASQSVWRNRISPSSKALDFSSLDMPLFRTESSSHLNVPVQSKIICLLAQSIRLIEIFIWLLVIKFTTYKIWVQKKVIWRFYTSELYAQFSEGPHFEKVLLLCLCLKKDVSH